MPFASATRVPPACCRRGSTVVLALGAIALGAIAGAALPAAAHIELSEPRNRYNEQKLGPCGRGGGEDGRTDRFTRYAPGERITVRFTETIDHEGSFIIAFDDDGADEEDFAANVLLTAPDPADALQRSWAFDVTLPDVTCTNCTLRLQQVMTTSPTPQPADLYFQCADLVLGDGESAPAEVQVLGCTQGGAASPLWALAAVLLGRCRRR
jgi:hypothetical protein